MRVWSFLYGNEHTPLFIYLCLCKTNHKRTSYLKKKIQSRYAYYVAVTFILQICIIAYVTYLSYR